MLPGLPSEMERQVAPYARDYASYTGSYIGPYIGVDEAGRGCLAGPVMAAALFWPGNIPEGASPVPGLADSKTLKAEKRVQLAQALEDNNFYFAVGQAWPEEIDKLNILNATFLAMSRAVLALYELPGLQAQTRLPGLPAPALAPLAHIPLLIDGNHRIPPLFWQMAGAKFPLPEQRAIIKGDALLPGISAASIIAKTRRDQFMEEMHRLYPEYNFAAHKGYGTAEHLAALQTHGPCPIHRQTFARVKPAT